MRRSVATFDLDARLRAIASKQLGLVTFDQAYRNGIDKHALARRRAAGALVAVFPKVLRLASIESTPRHQALAAVLAVPGSIVAATSAAIVHQMPVPPRALPDDAVLSVATDRLVRVRGITVVRHLAIPPSVTWMTGRLATPAAALLLLPRFVDDAVVERCLDHCVVHRLTTVSAMRTLLERMPSHAVHRRRLLVDLLDARSSGMGHRSRIEQRVGCWLRDAGLRGWVRNYRVAVGGGDEVEVDFGWPTTRLALEVSPFFTHGSRVAQERDAERRRRLVAIGCRVIEAVDDDVVNQRAFAAVVSTLRSLGAT